MVGKYRVIDAHCHIYPEKIASRAVAGTDRFYGTVAACNGTTSGLLEAAGDTVDIFLVHSVATTPAQVRSINNFISSEVKTYPDRFFGFGTLHPESEDVEGDLNHLLELGLRGVKLHPDIQTFCLDSEKSRRIAALCEKTGTPILIHTGDYRYDYSNPNRLIPLLEEYPDLTIIGAHLGGWSVWEEAWEKMAKYPRLYVDCSSTFSFYDVEKAKDLICRWGFDRVLFGSDYPMWHPKNELETFLSLNLGEEANRKILSENAIKLFSLKL